MEEANVLYEKGKLKIIHAPLINSYILNIGEKPYYLEGSEFEYISSVRSSALDIVLGEHNYGIIYEMQKRSISTSDLEEALLEVKNLKTE